MNLTRLERTVRFLLGLQLGALGLMAHEGSKTLPYFFGSFSAVLLVTALLGVRPVVALVTFARHIRRQGFYTLAKD